MFRKGHKEGKVKEIISVLLLPQASTDQAHSKHFNAVDHLTLMAILSVSSRYYPHFADRETEPQELALSQTLMSGGA